MAIIKQIQLGETVYDIKDAYSGFITRDVNNLTNYTGADTPDFELFHSVPFKYNRVAIYPSYVLHCALYEKSNQDDNPRTGRLTANNFIVSAL